MKVLRFFTRLPPGVSRRQTILPADAKHVRLSTLWGKCFNIFASVVLVLVSSVVMARLIRSDPDSAANFAPFYVLTIFLIGGFLFSGRQGKWITLKVVIQALFIFLVLPLCILLYAAFHVNSPPAFDSMDRQVTTNSPWRAPAP